MSNNTDTQQRKLALDPTQSFIVRAPAGSGKTELLIRRYLKLLQGVNAPEEIIAITFTRKAAAEMRQRVMVALEQARSGERDNNLRFNLARAAEQHNQSKQWQLQENPARLQILTIDSFCRSITRKTPLLSQLGSKVNPLDDPSELYLSAAERTIADLETQENWSAAVAELLRYLDNDLPKLRQLLAIMLGRRDQWLRHLGQTHINRTKLEQALTDTIQSTLAKLNQSFSAKQARELIALAKFAASNLADINSTSEITQCADLNSLPEISPQGMPQWCGIAELLLKKTGEWRKKIDKKTGFPAPDKTMKQRYMVLLNELSSNQALLAKLQAVRYLPAARLSDNQWQIIQALSQLLPVTVAYLQVLFVERGEVDFTEIQQAALRALGHYEAPSELALQLDYRIQHILVDEFQDVSISQYQLLAKLTEGWGGNDGRTLFLVGDPMQSIYRFREAEVSLFLRTFECERLAQVPLKALTLEVNFRAMKNLISWVNCAFTEVFPEATVLNDAVVNYSPFTAADQSNEGGVTIHPLFRDEPNKAAAQEAAAIVELIRRERQESPENSIAVLVRNRNQLPQIIVQLKRAHLPFQAVDIEPLGKRQAILDCLALTRALLHPADRVAWLALLRAPWCGLTLADLHALTSSKKVIWDCMNDPKQAQRLSEEGRQRLDKLRAILGKAFAQRRSKTLRRFVETVWLEIGGPATLAARADLDNVRTFFEVLQNHDQGGDLMQPEKLEQYLKNLFAAGNPEADEKLQIMTIHKAKGLEFDTVILPGLERTNKADDKKLLLWHERLDQDGGQSLLLAPIKQTGDQEDKLYNYLGRLEKNQCDNEANRLIYVAATRAKKYLHLFGTVKAETNQIKQPLQNSLLATLWPIIKTEYTEKVTDRPAPLLTAETPKITQTTVTKIRRHALHWTRPSVPASTTWQTDEQAINLINLDEAIEFQWAKEIIRHIGIVVHHCLQRMAEEGLEIWNETHIQAQKSYYEYMLKRQGSGKISWASEQVQAALSKTIQDPRGQWLLSGEHREQRNEYALTGLYDGKIVSIKIDRTFVDHTGTRWLIDYKTSRHEGANLEKFLGQEQARYQQQLKKYATLIRAMETRPIKLGLYFPLLGGWREWCFT